MGAFAEKNMIWNMHGNLIRTVYDKIINSRRVSLSIDFDTMAIFKAIFNENEHVTCNSLAMLEIPVPIRSLKSSNIGPG